MAGAPLVLLHGFTQTAQSWAPIVDLLAGTFDIVLPDAPGHGGSAAVKADLWQTAALLAELAQGRASWAGYSMGGRTALHVALAHPEKVDKLVLISATAGIEHVAERAARREADEALAARVERGGLEAFLSEWLARPLFATLAADRAGLEARLANSPAGLASSLRLAGAGSQASLWGRLNELRARALPVLLVVGEQDEKYRRLATRIARRIGGSADVLVVKGAGHACHLEQPAVVAAAVARWCGAGAPLR